MFEGSLNMWLTPRYGGYLGYDPKDIEAIQRRLQEAQGLASDRATAEFTASTTTFHEAREIQGKKPLPVKDFVIINSIPVHVEDLDEYIAALTGEKINPQLMPPPTTITEVPDDSTDNLDNSDSNGSNAPAHRPNSSGNGKNFLSLPSRRKALDLHPADEKAAYLKSVESQRTKWEKTITGRLQGYFADEHKTIAAAINRGSVDNAVDNCQHALMVLEQQGTLKNLMVSLYQDVGTDSGESVIKDLKYGEKPFEQKQIALDFNLYSPDVLVYLLSLAGTKVQQIDSTTLALLISELADGVEAGESIAQLSQRVDDLYLAQIIPNRSQTIAATEVVAASNYGTMEAAKASDLALNKVWLATNDGHTKPDHREADGQTEGMDEPFEVDGEQLMYPAELSLGASAKEIVNCRCTTYYQQAPDSSLDETEIGKALAQVARSFPQVAPTRDQYRELLRAKR